MLDDILLLTRWPLGAFSYFSSAMLLQAVLQIFFLFTFSVLFFGFRPEPAALGCFLLLLAAAAPMFYGLAWLAGAFFLRFGRGEGVLNHALNILLVAAGTYFPLKILPAWLRSEAVNLSPFTILLNETRRAFAGDFAHVAQATAALFTVGTLVGLVGLAAFELSLRHVRGRGCPNFSRS